MTEAEWLACEEPGTMLASLSGRASERKLRLFACACVRRAWHLLQDERSQSAVEAGERYADKLLPPEETMRAWELANEASRPIPWAPARETATLGAAAATVALWAPAMWGAGEAARWVAQCGLVHKEQEQRKQADTLRDIVRAPTHPSCPASFTRDQPAIQAIAVGAYDERELPSGHLDNLRLAVLSDALEEAGCTDEALLSHLRSPGPHVRGCWALDLILTDCR